MNLIKDLLGCSKIDKQSFKKIHEHRVRRYFHP